MKISKLTLVTSVFLTALCTLEIYPMSKDEKELKDRKESQDAQKNSKIKESIDANNSPKIYSSDRRFMLKPRADGTSDLFEIKPNGELSKLAIKDTKVELTSDEIHMAYEITTYTLDKPIEEASSVAFSPDGNFIAVAKTAITRFIYSAQDIYEDTIKYEEGYIIQLYTIDQATRKFTLVQQGVEKYITNKGPARLLYLPNGKGLCLWHPNVGDTITSLLVNQQTGLLGWMHTLSEKSESLPESLVFSPNNKSAIITHLSSLSVFSVDPNASSLPVKVEFEPIPGMIFLKTIHYHNSIQTINCKPQEKPIIAYSADSTLAAMAVTKAQAASTSAGSAGLAEAKARNETAGGFIYIFNVNPQTGKFEPQSNQAISLDFEPVAITFNPRFADIIVAGNTKSGGIIRRYGELRGAWELWAQDTLPGQTITSLTVAPGDGEMAITIEQGLIEIRNSTHVSPINFRNTKSAVKAPNVLGPVVYNAQGTLAAAIVNGAVTIYIVDQVTGAFKVLTDDLADYERKSRPIGFGPETEVISVPNEMGGFSIVPRKEGEKIMADLQARKAAAINHIIAQWEKELDDLCVEDKLKILRQWAQVAQEKQWALLVKESPALFKKQLQEARDAFEREVSYASEDINETEVEQELERLAKMVR